MLSVKNEMRLAKLRDRMRAKGLSALLVTQIPNVFYLSGFSGDTGSLVVGETELYLLVDPRFTVQARGESPSATIVEYVRKSAVTAAADLANDIKPRSLGFEADNMSVSDHRRLRKLCHSATRLRATSGMIEQLRMIKDADEISRIRAAAGIADCALDSALLEIRPGITEKDVALLIDSAMRKMGADKEAFDTIAACGPNAACPHARPSASILEPGQMLKLDFGARCSNYNSDITRTVCLVRPDEKLREIYGIVLEAQLRAIEAIVPGKAGVEVDRVARDFIASKGYGENFGHGLGHGLGILVHDHPAFSQTSELTLEAGMVVTVEPGIYIEGWGGVRIEDDVVVTKNGAEVITKFPKDLRCIG